MDCIVCSVDVALVVISAEHHLQSISLRQLAVRTVKDVMLFQIALEAVSIGRINIYLCIGLKLLLALFAVLGIIGPVPTVIADCVVSISLIINSFRTLSKI